MPDDDWVLFRDLIEVLPGQRDIELGVVEHHRADPLSWGSLVSFLPQIGEQLAHAPDVGIHAIEFVDAAHVTVRIDEARRNGHLLRVDDTRSGGGEIANVRRRADRNEAAVLDGERLGARQCRIDCENTRVEHDQIGLRARPGRSCLWLLRGERREP